MTQYADPTGFPNGLRLGSDDASIIQQAGMAMSGLLRLGANVALDEDVVIGGDTYRVAVVNTDSGEVTAGGDLNHLNDYISVYIPSHGLVGGDLIRVENEIIAVHHVLDANHVIGKRGVSGTTVVAHADDLAIFTEADPGDGDIAVGLVTTLTPTAYIPALVADINERGTEKVTAQAIGTTGIFVFTSNERGDGVPRASTETIATTETLGGAGNAWDAANMAYGYSEGAVSLLSIVPTAAEVTAGSIKRAVVNATEVIQVIAFVTSSGVPLVHDGAADIVDGVLTIDNSGAADWDANDTLLVFVRS